MKTGYEFSRNFFDWSFENPDLINSNDIALFCWFIEKNNRCGWSEKFSVTSTENMSACGFKTYPPYKKAFDNLVKLGFINLIRKSANQHQTNIIALSKIAKATTKALDKALLKQPLKHIESNSESTFDIIKQQTVNQEPITIDFNIFWELYGNKTGRKKCEAKWGRLKIATQELILKTLPDFLAYKPFESYTHPNPETYLNNERWNDVIPSAPQNVKIAEAKRTTLQEAEALKNSFG